LRKKSGIGKGGVMVKWEYALGEHIRDATDGRMAKFEEFLNKSGRDGWELVTIYSGYAIFKRPDEAFLREQIDLMRMRTVKRESIPFDSSADWPTNREQQWDR